MYREDNSFKAAGFIIGAALFIILMFYGCSQSGDRSDAIRSLEAFGATDIDVYDSGYFTTHWEGCSDSDTFFHKASFKNSQGKTVKATVCCGMFFKGCTVRYLDAHAR